MKRRVAIVHDWLVTFAGAERVLEGMLSCFPEADLFTLFDFLPADQRAFLKGKVARTSFLQRMPFARTRYRDMLPLMPLAIEQFDLSGYDLVISSSFAVAKGVVTGPDQLHICMCYSPARYAWDLQSQYLGNGNYVGALKSGMARLYLHRFRTWDAASASRVDDFIAISHFIARRIRKTYRREATVIYPPVDLRAFVPAGQTRGDHYVTASRMVPYKKIPMIVEAFAGRPDRKLIVIGDGPDMPEARRRAADNVTFLGRQPLESLVTHLGRAKAFIFAAEEDFGIAPLEAQACGTPVIAYGKGAAVETIAGPDSPAPTGVFFLEQTPQAIADAVDRFESQATHFSPAACRANAARFDEQHFLQAFREHVEERWARFLAEQESPCPSC